MAMTEHGHGFPDPSLVEERARGWLARCRRAGAEEAEVYVKFSRTRRISTPAGRSIEEEEGFEAGAALRVFRAELWSFSAGSWCESDLPLADLPRVRRGRARFRWLPAASIRCLDFARAAGPVDRVKLAQRACGINAQIAGTVMEEYIFNSHGLAVGMSGSLCALETRQGPFTDTLVSRDPDGLRPDVLTEEQMGTEQVALPAAFVLAPRVSTHLASLLGQCLRADWVAAGNSCVGRDDEGRICFSPVLTAVTDGTEGPFGRPFDGEGVTASKVDLVVDGRLLSLLYDTRNAILFGRRSTASSVRDSYRDTPSIGSQSLTIAAGDGTIDELRELAQLELTRLSPLGRWDPHTGNLSFPACGYILRGGRRQHPIQTVLEGSLVNLLNAVEVCAGDVTGFLHDGWCAAPSMLIRRRA